MDLSVTAPVGFQQDLETAIGEAGFSVTYEPISGGARGYTSPDHRVVIRDDLDEASRAATLAHELGFIKAGHLDRMDEYHMGHTGSRDVMEIEAESIGHDLCAMNGLDSTGAAGRYVATWGRTNPGRVRQAAETVTKTVKAIVDDHRWRNSTFSAAARHDDRFRTWRVEGSQTGLRRWAGGGRFADASRRNAACPPPTAVDFSTARGVYIIFGQVGGTALIVAVLSVIRRWLAIPAPLAGQTSRRHAVVPVIWTVYASVLGLLLAGMILNSLTRNVGINPSVITNAWTWLGTVTALNAGGVEEVTIVAIPAWSRRGPAAAAAARPTVMTPARMKEAPRMREEGATLVYVASTLQVGRAAAVRALGQVEKQHER